MKVRVNIEGQCFEVEIDSLKTHPVIARVNGDPVEVWLDEGARRIAEPGASSVDGPGADGSWVKEIRAPIPGTIRSVAVRQGDQVSCGDELCILEAMKMNNVIRSSRAGLIGGISISPGQTVKRNDVLFVFQD